MDSNILNKLQDARQYIKESDLKKAGHNDFSNYDYYTPDQVAILVHEATNKTKTIVLTDFKADEFGLFQELKFVDIEKPESFLLFHYRTKHGALTASNEAQEMGGTDTYSDRYIKMKVFDIKDNSLDPDSKDQRKSSEKPPSKKPLSKNPMSSTQKEFLDGAVKHLPIKESGLLVAWLRKQHSYEEARNKIGEINIIIDEFSNR